MALGIFTLLLSRLGKYSATIHLNFKEYLLSITFLPSVVSFTAVFVLSHNAPRPHPPPCQQMATHTWTTFLSNCFIIPQKWLIICQQTENDASFRTKNEPLWFQLVSESGFCFAFINTDIKIKVFHRKNRKTHYALKWSTSTFNGLVQNLVQ